MGLLSITRQCFTVYILSFKFKLVAFALVRFTEYVSGSLCAVKLEKK